MRELSIFVDESGSDVSPTATTCLPSSCNDQSESTRIRSRHKEGALRAKGLPDILLQRVAARERQGPVLGLDLRTRKMLAWPVPSLPAMPVRYYTFAYATKQPAPHARQASVGTMKCGTRELPLRQPRGAAIPRYGQGLLRQRPAFYRRVAPSRIEYAFRRTPSFASIAAQPPSTGFRRRRTTPHRTHGDQIRGAYSHRDDLVVLRQMVRFQEGYIWYDTQEVFAKIAAIGGTFHRGFAAGGASTASL